MSLNIVKSLNLDISFCCMFRTHLKDIKCRHLVLSSGSASRGSSETSCYTDLTVDRRQPDEPCIRFRLQQHIPSTSCNQLRACGQFSSQDLQLGQTVGCDKRPGPSISRDQQNGQPISWDKYHRQSMSREQHDGHSVNLDHQNRQSVNRDQQNGQSVNCDQRNRQSTTRDQQIEQSVNRDHGQSINCDQQNGQSRNCDKCPEQSSSDSHDQQSHSPQDGELHSHSVNIK